MAQIDHNGIIIDCCTHCNGLWFDHMEIERLQKLKGSEVIDRGSSRTGANFDTIRDVSCPRCNIPMLMLSESGKDPFSYEFCPQCNGIFLDAGEFKKMKERTKSSIFAYIRTILK